MSQKELQLSEEKRALYEALGVDGVVRELEAQGGKGQNETFRQASAWLRCERKRIERRADLRFWIPQAIAILSAVIATIAVTISVMSD